MAVNPFCSNDPGNALMTQNTIFIFLTVQPSILDAHSLCFVLKVVQVSSKYFICINYNVLDFVLYATGEILLQSS